MRKRHIGPCLALTVLIAGCADEDWCKYFEPVADAGEDFEGPLGVVFTLDGTGSLASCDLDLAYIWAFTTTPDGSSITSAAVGTANGTAHAGVVHLLPDIPGLYVASLTVTDGHASSEPDFVAFQVTH